MKKALFALIATVAAANVLAADMPIPTCKKPDLPSKFASEVQFKVFNRHMAEYKDCVNKFVSAQNDIAKQAITAGNAAVADFNAFAKQVHDLQSGDQ